MLGEICAVAAAFTWSVSVVLFKRSESVSPQAINLFKNVSASVLLLLTMPLMGLNIDWTRSGTEWAYLVASGVLGIAIADTLVFMALRKLGASLLAVVECIYAPVIVALGVLVLGESLSWAFLFGAILVMGGVSAATVQRASHVRKKIVVTPEVRLGIVYGIAGIAAMAAGVVLAKPVLENGHLVEVTLVRLLAGVLGQVVWMAVVPSQRSAMAVLKPGPVWRTLLPASVLGSYIAMLFWLGGFKWASVSTASVLNQLSSVFTIVLARMYLGEPVTRRRALGAAAAVAGAAIILV
jgi:drug/metabolite transporter (DMT)-like permease